MRNIHLNIKILTFFSVLFLFTSFTFAGNDELKEGEISPNPSFTPITKYQDYTQDLSLYDFKEGKVLLVAFVPTLTDKNNYMRVMTDAFETYFAEGLAFNTNNPYSGRRQYDLQVLFVTGDDKATAQNFAISKNINYAIASDADMSILSLFGLDKFKNDNSASVVYIINKENKITYFNSDYKAEGEKLKSVQAELFKLLDIKTEVPDEAYLPVFIGDTAPDFNFGYVTGSGNDIKSQLSSYKDNKKVLLAFYPAPYSYSCAMEVVSLEKYAAEQKLLEELRMNPLENHTDLEILMVSVSNNGILAKWKNDNKLENVKLVSDYDRSISMKYNSFSDFGYNKRTMFLVDKEGRISYIDWDYDVVNDLNPLKDAISLLDTKIN